MIIPLLAQSIIDSAGIPILLLINCFGVVHVETHKTKGTAIGSLKFIDFLERIAPMIPRNCFLMLDNASIHRTEAVMEILQRHNVNYIFLPPYSPGYTAIELLFGYLKKVMKLFFHTNKDVDDVVERILRRCPAPTMQGFYREMRRNWEKNEM